MPYLKLAAIAVSPEALQQAQNTLSLLGGG